VWQGMFAFTLLAKLCLDIDAMFTDYIPNSLVSVIVADNFTPDALNA
jgi:hypothetical protein